MITLLLYLFSDCFVELYIATIIIDIIGICITIVAVDS